MKYALTVFLSVFLILGICDVGSIDNLLSNADIVSSTYSHGIGN